MNKGPLFKKFDKIVTRHGDIGFIVDVQPLTVFNRKEEKMKNLFKKPERTPIEIHQSKPQRLSPFEETLKKYSDTIIKILINNRRK
jgi:hypothetical protein